MKRLSTILVVIAIAGFVMTLLQRRENEPLRIEYDALVDRVGLLNVVDSERIHMMRLPSDDPMVFRWHAYYPEGKHLLWRSTTIHHGPMDLRNNHSNRQDLILRLEFEFTDKGIQYTFSDGTDLKRNYIQSDQLCQLIQEHWTELVVEAVGRPTFLSDGSDPIDLIRIELPEHVHDDISLIENASKFKTEPVFQLTLGTRQTFSQRPAGF